MAKPKRTKEQKLIDSFVRYGGHDYLRETFLRDVIVEHLDLAFSRMAKEDRLSVTQDFVTIPGAELSVHLEFGGPEVRLGVEIFRPGARPKSLHDQAQEILDMPEQP